MKKNILFFIFSIFSLCLYAQTDLEKAEKGIVGKWKCIYKNKPKSIPDVFLEFSGLVEKSTDNKNARYKLFTAKCLFYDFEVSKTMVGLSELGIVSVGFAQDSYDPFKKITNYYNYQGVQIEDKLYIVRYDADNAYISSDLYERVKE